jgi:thiol-disulfide isomerase/thioredoxin
MTLGWPLRWLIVGVVVVVAVVIAFWPRSQHPASPPAAAPTSVDLAPARAAADLASCPTGPRTAGMTLDVTVTCLADGAQVELASLLDGAPALVDVWASWCVPCQRELPALDSYAVTPGAIRVIGVQVQSPQQDGLQLLAGLRVRHLPMVFDTTGAASKALRLPVGLPVSYLVKSDGTATLIISPARVLDSVEQVKQAVATYLGGAS